MRFQAGDKTDIDHCLGLTHEFLRCRDAFREFEHFATVAVLKGEAPLLSYQKYNAYSAFIHHLYEFIRGAHAREALNTKITDRKLTSAERAKLDEDYVSAHVQRLLTNRRAAIRNGSAASWENDISYYPEEVPREFAREFRKYRNLTHAHVSHERASKINPSDFFAKYHKYIYLLYRDCSWWEPRGQQFPDFNQITTFGI
ncbi:MAG: hypothetical protein WCF22_14965 [Candidatus Sulfotelmatobacter sp.]